MVCATIIHLAVWRFVSRFHGIPAMHRWGFKNCVGEEENEIRK